MCIHFVSFVSIETYTHTHTSAKTMNEFQMHESLWQNTFLRRIFAAAMLIFNKCISLQGYEIRKPGTCEMLKMTIMCFIQHYYY